MTYIVWERNETRVRACCSARCWRRVEVAPGAGRVACHTVACRWGSSAPFGAKRVCVHGEWSMRHGASGLEEKRHALYRLVRRGQWPKSADKGSLNNNRRQTRFLSVALWRFARASHCRGWVGVCHASSKRELKEQWRDVHTTTMGWMECMCWVYANALYRGGLDGDAVLYSDGLVGCAAADWVAANWGLLG